MFKFELFREGKLVQIAFSTKKQSLLSGLKDGRKFIEGDKYDCVEIYKNGEWIKSYSK